MLNVRVFDTPDALADGAADEIADWLGNGGTLGLAGGGTPIPTYRRLREMALPWSSITGWMTDERHVDLEHPECNAWSARQALFDHVPAVVLPVPWDPDATVRADLYERQMLELLPREPDGPRPGLVLLGVGDDGHTASLFPGSTALEEDERWYVATDVEGKGWRMTATMPLLARAERTLFIISGDRKAGVVHEIVSEGSDLPAAVVAASSPDAWLLLDRDAAAELD